MASFIFKGGPHNTVGELPRVGSAAPDFRLVKTDFSVLSLADLKGQRVVLNVFPSLATGVCSASVRRFNAEAAGLKNTSVVCVSMDLPFVHKSFCEAEGLDRVVPVSDFRDGAFGKTYGMKMADGDWAGLLARSVIVVDEKGAVIHSQLVPETGSEPDYAAALAVLG